MAVDLGLGPTAALGVTNTLFLSLTLAAVTAIYWAGVWGMRTVRGSPSLARLGRAFGHAFVTIGLATWSPTTSLVLFQEQAQFTYLLSDPLGEGSDTSAPPRAGSTTG